MKVRKAIIPAAGLGTRLLPNTKSIPKEMLPLVDKPVLQYIVEEAVAAGVEQILIITNRGKSPIEDYFDYTPDLEERLLKDGAASERRKGKGSPHDPRSCGYGRCPFPPAEGDQGPWTRGLACKELCG